jgi:hypothetical protein
MTSPASMFSKYPGKKIGQRHHRCDASNAPLRKPRAKQIAVTLEKYPWQRPIGAGRGPLGAMFHPPSGSNGS